MATTGLIERTLDSSQVSRYRGMATTGLEVKVHLRMAQAPTSYYHLLDPEQDRSSPVRCTLPRRTESTRRVRVTSSIEDYSAKAINTFELAPNHTHPFDQLPTLFHDRIRDLNELTRATLNILVEDLDGKVELTGDLPNLAPGANDGAAVHPDPKTGDRRDMTRYLGAFVTPNAPSLMKFLRAAAEHHPDKYLVGYQGNPDQVPSQVEALFDALKNEANITYVNSVISFSPDQGFAGQRVRLPRESLADGQANCIDGTVLFASLLEGISMNPAIVTVPGHALLSLGNLA